MSQASGTTPSTIDYDTTIIGALELSEKKWVFAVQLPGVSRHSRHVLETCGDGLASFVERLKAKCAAAGRAITRVILTHEAGRDGFWLARFLTRRGIEVHVMQPSSLPVDRRARRAKTDIIDVEMLLRTLMAWLRGEPRVCSMVPIPSEADEEARRAYREREDLTGERRSIVNKIDGILATLGIKGYKALRRDRREQLDSLRQPDGDPVPQKAKARIERLLDRLDLVLKLIEQVEAARDAVLKKDTPADEAERMIRSLTALRSIGADFATLLVREAFVRQFRNRRALGGYVGLGGTPFSSGGSEREQGIGKDGNRRLRAAMVELAWMWLRWQPDSALSIWFRARVGATGGGRVKKIMVVALARKLLVALWRYVKDGVIPDGATMKPA
ncbi:IS110 family transposase [Rhodoblastus sphagnicola]|uniref:IS110 family transposase n=1 Tax=Rhodoblastus sphagnicola TaxID=333368 RepID=A0A2S6N0U5_9HYPH|nr:IS110 family transposase [Rhodoblastus sphagnicola]MBB4201246.1 transposase [Rhodoblastus sphagnicola]PPQ28253.1 IS110 family transposase [Rhodoblastus sphagnicola]